MAGQYGRVPVSWNVLMIASPLEVEFAVDGNPVKCSLVRQLPPEVALPELSGDPALYARILAAAGYSRRSPVRREIVHVPTFTAITHLTRRFRARWGDVGACLASLGMQWRLVAEATATRPIIPMKVIRANFATAQAEFAE